MVKLINLPTEIKAQGNMPKIIREFIGRVNTATENISIAQMSSPKGWAEEGQTPEFDEYSVVLKGVLRIKTKNEIIDVKEGQAVLISKNDWVQYSTPFEGGAQYIAVCIPAFSPTLVHRDANS